MKIDLFSIGKFTIHGYGLMIAIGILCCVAMASYRAKKNGLDQEAIVDIGIYGVEATASAIYMARNGSSKEEIKEYIEKEFRYDLDRSLDKIRLGYHMDETCQKTVPEAIIAFLEARDFEDAIRNAVSLGGDTDTLGAITGSIAEAFYGIPAVLIAECRRRLDEGLMTDVLDEFDRVLGRNGNADSDDKKDD